jgi:hypothetical protein
MASISFGRSFRRRRILPPYLILAFLEQAASHEQRPTVLLSVSCLLPMSVAATLGTMYVAAPFCIVILFAVSAAFSASLCLIGYVYRAFGRKKGTDTQYGKGGPQRFSEIPSFCSGSVTDGAHYWLARDLMKWLGYETWQSLPIQSVGLLLPAPFWGSR